MFSNELGHEKSLRKIVIPDAFEHVLGILASYSCITKNALLHLGWQTLVIMQQKCGSEREDLVFNKSCVGTVNF